MPKMTLKEAQEVLENWRKKIISLILKRDSNHNKYDFPHESEIADKVDHLLEAARVVERSKFIQIIDDHSKSKTVLCETGEKHVCSSICLDFIKEILSDNQEGK